MRVHLASRMVEVSDFPNYDNIMGLDHTYFIEEGS